MSEIEPKNTAYIIRHRPTYGFIGREMELLTVKELLDHNNIILLTGTAGIGKTAFLDLMGQKLEESEDVKKSFFFGFDENRFTAGQIINILGSSIIGSRDEKTFRSSDPSERRSLVIKRLKTEPFCIILDNCDFITSSTFTPETDYTPNDLENIKDFLSELSDCRTVVLMASRSDDMWGKIAGATFNLEGLDEKEVLKLAYQIFERINIEIVSGDEDFSALLKVLEGNPLAMETILPCLADKTPSDVFGSLIEAGVKDRGIECLMKLMEYSFNSLPDESRRILLFFAPFRGVVNMHFIENYINELNKFRCFEGITVRDFFPVIQECFNRGFMESSNSGTSTIAMQPLFKYFIEHEMKETLSEDDMDSLMQAFLHHYYGIAGVIVKFFQSQNPGAPEYACKIADREYENIKYALNIALKKNASVLLLYLCLDSYFDSMKDHSRGLEVGKYILDSLEKYPEALLKDKMGSELVSIMDSIAYRLFITGEYKEAGDLYLKVLEVNENLAVTDESLKKKKSAGMLHQLGMTSQKLGEYGEARKYYNRALNYYMECKDRYKQAKEYTFLGETAFHLQNYKESCNDYQNALRIFGEFGDKDSLGYVHEKIALSLEGADNYNEALEHLDKAMKISEERGDRDEAAQICNKMGELSIKAGYLPEASEYYYRVMNTYIDSGNTEGRADVYRQLARIDVELMRFDEARDHYRKAVELFEELGRSEEAEKMREELLDLENGEE